MRVLILIMMVLSAKISFAETPWYVGAGIGTTNYQGDSVNDVPQANIDIDGWQTSWSLFGGYQFNEKWAVEAGYIDFGETDDYDPNGQILGIGVDYDSTGFYLNGQYHIPLNNSLSLDLVGGWLFGEANAKEVFPPNTLGTPQSASFTDNGPMLGMSFTWQLARSFGIRGTADYFAIDYDSTIKNPWRLSADIIWNF
jgi:OOP family OmpA-OmpF porin